MTLAQVLALINQFIIQNGNNEITADVLRPILEEMVQQPNDLVGELNALQTTDKSNIVSAINEVLNSFTGSDIEVLTGATDPNVTPPLLYGIGDFYIWQDNGLKGFFQFNGIDWVEIKTAEQPEIDLTVKPVENRYVTMVAMFADQVNQTSGFLQLVDDPNDLPNSGYYEKLDTSNGVLSDYKKLTTEEQLIVENNNVWQVKQVLLKALSFGNYSGLTQGGVYAETNGVDIVAIIFDNDYTDILAKTVSLFGAESFAFNIYNATKNTNVRALWVSASFVDSGNKVRIVVSGVPTAEISQLDILHLGLPVNVSGQVSVDSVNGQTGVVVLDPDDLDDTATVHKFTSQADIDRLANTSGTNTGDQDISGIAINAGDIATIQAEQIIQNDAIALNTAKRSYPLADENRLANTSGTNTGDQDISGIATNAAAIVDLQNDKADRLPSLYNATVTGAFDLDLATFDSFYGILTGNTTLSISNAPTAVTDAPMTKYIELASTTAETLTLPVGWHRYGEFVNDGSLNALTLIAGFYPTVGLRVSVFINLETI